MPSMLPNASAIDANLTMGATHIALATKAMKFGGACTKKFSQGDASMTKGLGSIYHPHGWGGVCFAMTIQWITFHANEADFWGWLYGQDTISKTPYGSIDSNRGRLIVGLQGAMKSDTAHAEGLVTASDRGMTWRELATYWLLQDGIKKISYGNVNEGATGTAASLAGKVAPDSYRIGGCYRELIWVRSSGGAHACAAWVGQDATFFDPNYGEYWFPRASAFRSWLAFFWEKTGYAAKYDNWYCNSYSKLVKR